MKDKLINTLHLLADILGELDETPQLGTATGLRCGEESVKSGDFIQLTTPFGVYEGTVKSAANYGDGDSPNWYIEITNDQANVGSADDYHRRATPVKRPAYTYWKQKVDGGAITQINGKPIY